MVVVVVVVTAAGFISAAAVIEVAGPIERSVRIECGRRRQIHGVWTPGFLRARGDLALTSGALEQGAGTDEPLEGRGPVFCSGFGVRARDDASLCGDFGMWVYFCIMWDGLFSFRFM